MKAPDILYLQTGCDCLNECTCDDDVEYSNQDTTHCENRIFRGDVEYIRADVRQDKIDALKAENEKLRAAMKPIITRGEPNIIDPEMF